ncbi:MAG: HD domain-containing protein [Spirochaetia bacterium]|nr:HD domain-containing protein [Spirochaetia bacterium]
MHYKIDKIIIDRYLSDNQKEVLKFALSIIKHGLNENLDKQTNVDETNEIEDLFPIRFILNENEFIKLNQETVNIIDRKIKVNYCDEQTNKSIIIHFYRSSFLEKENFTIKNNIIFLQNNLQMHDVLQIAGILSSFPEFSVEKNSQIQIINNFNDLPFSARRYFIENIILSKKPTIGFYFLDELNCLKEIMPEIAAGKNLSQNKFHKYDIYEHLIRSCEAMEIPDLVLRFSALLHDIGKVPTRRVKENGEATFYNHEMVSAYMLVPIMKRFGIPKPIGLKIKYYVRNHMFHYTDEWSDKAVRRFLRKVSRADLANLILLRKSDRIGSGKTNPFPRKLQNLIDHIDDVIMRDLEMKVTDLEINGLDLMNLGLTQGPLMGRVLNQLLAEVKNEVTRNNHEELIERAKSILANTETIIEAKETLKT